MGKQDLEPYEYQDKFIKLVANPGALLNVIDLEDKPNVMAIGWCTLGRLWSKPMCIVYVRPSRHSYTSLEQVRQFTVNCAGPELAKAVEICGTVSGRDEDKFAATDLIALPAKKVKPPIIQQCILHYECNVVHFSDVIEPNLRRNLVEECYSRGDLHRLYFGQIVACYGDVEALKKI